MKKKRKKFFILWLLCVIILCSFFLFITILYFEGKINSELYIPSLLGDLTLIATILPFYKQLVIPYINDHLQEIDLSVFVDRNIETRTVLNAIKNGKKIVYISGRTGIGKKFLLHKLIDIFNKKGEFAIGSSVYSLYINVEAGENIRQSIKNKIGVADDLNNPDLIRELHRVTKAKVIILLVNVANSNFYFKMEEDIHALIKIDDNIIFVITADSISEMYEPIKLSNFTEKEVREIALKKNVDISEDNCRDIAKKAGGLPILINCLIKQVKMTGTLSDFSEANTFIKGICDCLNSEQQELISLIAYYSIANIRISKYQIGKHCNICTKQNINELVKNGLIEFSSRTGEITIQSFFSMIIQELYESQRFERCGFIYKMLEKEKNESKYKLIFLLLSNIRSIDSTELVFYLSNYLENKDYYFLIYLYETLEDFNKLNINYDHKIIRLNLLFCYIHSLLEIGEYEKAKDCIDRNEPWISDINLRRIDTQLEFNFNFDIADMAHFFGDFELAIDSYKKLENSDINEAQKIKCQWAMGHCYRHLGDMRSMNIAISCFETIIYKKRNMNPTYYIRSYQSLILIKLFLNDKNYNYEKAFEDMLNYMDENKINRKNEIETSRQYALYQRIFQNQYEESLKTLNRALNDLEKKGLRIKYDYYFEIAEALRHKIIDDYDVNDYNESMSNYQKALDFSKRSGDISLRNISQIGIILLKISRNRVESSCLKNIIEICDFCKRKKIIYIFNYAYKIKEYLLNDQFFTEGKDTNLRQLIKMKLFIM